jgi:4-hydroxy-tetrahydrodipicolinate reductase
MTSTIDQAGAAHAAPDAPAGTSTIRVLVAGPTGKMGTTLIAGLPGEAGIQVVGGLSRSDGPIGPRSFAGADVLVDFTNAETAPALLLAAIDAGVRPVTGTSGLPIDALDAIDRAARDRGIAAAWCPHFRLGGALLSYLARIVAPLYEQVEIVETHHATKHDSPSGTALAIAAAIRDGRDSDLVDPPVLREHIPGTRGGAVSGVRIHSLRLPGVLGRHDIVFGGDDETFTISHEELGREAYVPTVAITVREVMKPGRVGLIRGFESVIGLPGTT